MTSHLEATKAAAPMDSVLFQDGTQSQASVPSPFQNSLLDGCCCHDEYATTYFALCLLEKKKRVSLLYLPAYLYTRLLINIETTISLSLFEQEHQRSSR